MGKGASKAHRLYHVIEDLRRDGARDLQFWLEQEKNHLEKMIGGNYVVFHGHHLIWSSPAQAFLDYLLRPHAQHVDPGLPIWHLTLSGSSLHTFEYMTLVDIQSWMKHWARTWDFELQGHITPEESGYLHVNKMESYRQFKRLNYLASLRFRMIQHWMEVEWRKLLTSFEEFIDKPELDFKKEDTRICFSMMNELHFSINFDYYKGIWNAHFSPTLGREDLRSATFPAETDMVEALQPYKEHLLSTYNRLILEAYSKK